ncbi:MAG: hypothetical protein Q4D82_04975 [Neisseria sp.]|nr:hypothetical protein [Neisseria sp.]
MKPDFPLHFSFKILTPSNDFSVYDRENREIAYTRQRFFKIRERIDIYRDRSRKEKLFDIQADRIIDFNAEYTVRDAADNVLGKIKRAGMKSLWKTSYTVLDTAGRPLYTVQENNPWIAVLDGLVSDILVIGWLSGLFLNPSYGVRDTAGREIYLLKKEPSLLERKFSLHKKGGAEEGDDVLVLNAVMMLMLLERNDG